ncbi:MAG: thiol reductant ABC exporter subunit CydD [candidate division KSB1 bacterium]|nr:thiol reductant ABC exporter subunit CydD [candidate division KSB1 bacterium]
MNLDKRLLAYFFAQRRLLAASLTLFVVSGLAVILQAETLSFAVDGLFLGGKTWTQIRPLLTTFAIAALVRWLSLWGGRSSAAALAADIKRKLHRRLVDHLVRLGPLFVRTQQVGELKNTLIEGIEKLDAYFSEYLPQLFLAALLPLLILVFVFPLDRLSALILLATAPLIPFFMILIGDVAQGMTRRQWRLLSRLNAFFAETLQGILTIKLFRAGDFAAKIRRVTESYRHITLRVMRVAFLSALALELLSMLGIALIAVQIGLRLLYDRISFVQAFFILIVAPEFYQPLRQLGVRFHAGMEGFTAAQRIFQLLEVPPFVLSGRCTKVEPLRSLRFEDVSFAYSEGAIPAVQELSFEITAGERVALVGPSGAGKSTVFALLLRFAEPDSGVIRINETPLNEIDVEAWRRQIAWLPQQPFLFHASVAENIRVAKMDADQSEIEEAAKKAGLHAVLQGLPHGYATPVGEGGCRLSGGQARRVALARAFLRQAPLVLLDEPTGFLDRESEAVIRLVLSELEPTVLIIAHHLQTAAACDRILFIENGKVVESGSHDELLRRGGRYAAFLQTEAAA